MRVQRVELVCDGCKASNVALELPQGAPDLPLVELAHQLGWRVDLGAQSLCPGCRPRRRKGRRL